MGFKETVESLKKRFQEKITPDSKPEEIEEVNANASILDELMAEHEKVVAENAKFKDTIVRMVTSQGDSTPPEDDSTGSKSMSIEEAIEKVSKEGK